MRVYAPIIPNHLFDQEERQLRDVAAERATLAIIMNQPGLIIEAERLIPTDAFAVDLHQYIYRIMIWMAKEWIAKGMPYHFDAMSMLSAARFMGPQFEESFIAKTDGLEQVKSIEALRGSVQISQFTSYHDRLMDALKRRQMYRLSRDLQKACMDYHANPEAAQLGVRAEQAFGNVAFDTVRQEKRIQTLQHYGVTAMQRVEMKQQFPMSFNVPIPKFPFWNQVLNGGLPRKGLVMVCARPKVGKSSLFLDVAANLSTPVWVDTFAGSHVDSSMSVPVLYLDTEMSGEEMFFRQLTNIAEVTQSDIFANKLAEEGSPESNRMVTALAQLQNAKFYYANIAGADLDYVKSLMRQFRNQIVGTHHLIDRHGRKHEFSNPCVVIYDWFKLPDASGLKHAQETQLLGFQASAIKTMAFELDLPVLAAAQLNREAIHATPADWEWNAEAFISSSDRLAMFCSSMSVLRRLTGDEMEVMEAEHKLKLKNHKDQEFIPEEYNQKLHIILGRHCADYRPGIPLLLDGAMSRYKECNDDTIRHVRGKSSKAPKKQLPKAGQIKSKDGGKAEVR